MFFLPKGRYPENFLLIIRIGRANQNCVMISKMEVCQDANFMLISQWEVCQEVGVKKGGTWRTLGVLD